MQQPTNTPNPRWWNEKHDAAWKNARDEIRREPNAGSISDEQWSRSEPGMRYGYGARAQYASEMEWTDKLEAKLREEWNDLKSGKTWDEVKAAVRRGWDAARSKTQRPS